MSNKTDWEDEMEDDCGCAYDHHWMLRCDKCNKTKEDDSLDEDDWD